MQKKQQKTKLQDSGRLYLLRLRPQKILLCTMRLIIAILIIGCLQVSARGFSQNVSLKVKDAPLTKVFHQIEAQSGYVFFFDQALLRKAKTVTIDIHNLPLQKALDLCFKNQPLGYRIVNKNIVIQPKMEPKEISATTPPLADTPPTAHDVHIHVIDSTGKPLHGASVTVKGVKQGGETDEEGNITLAEVTGNETLVISYVGYETQEINIGDNSELVVVLKISISPLDEIQMIAYGTNTQRLNTGNVSTVSAKEIEEQPVSNPLLALEGRIPGLFITQASGVTGAGVKVQINGILRPRHLAFYKEYGFLVAKQLMAIGLLHDKVDQIKNMVQELKPEKETVADLMTVSEAAAFLSLAVPTIYSKASRREIPYSKQGKRLYFSKSELADWIKSGKKKTFKELKQEAEIHLKKLSKSR